MGKPADAVACVGCGVIGGGWVVHFLRAGCDVVAFDPDPAREGYVRSMIESAWPLMDQLGLAEGASPDRWQFTTDLSAAVSSAGFIQESAVEDETRKTELLGRIGELAPPEALIASSSSGFLAASLRRGCAAGDRFMIAHPFNPPYMVPLVELAGREGLGSGVLERFQAFYVSTGMRPVVLEKEIRGYIGNRIQASVFREVLHLISEGVASASDIDAAIKYGPGLRWALLGPTHVYALGGGAPERFPGFVDQLLAELDAGYATPDGFAPDEAAVERYTREASRVFDAAPFDQLCASRDRGLVELRRLVAELDRDQASGT